MSQSSMQTDAQSIIATPGKSKGSKGLIIGIIAVLVLAAGVGVGIYLVQQSQEIRNQAAAEATCAWTVRSTDCLSTESWCQKDFRCFPSDKAAQVNCNTTDTPAVLNDRINTACGTGDKGSDTTTICGKTQTWSKFDKDLKSANFPGPYIHQRTEARAYIGAACPETLIGTGGTPSPTPDYNTDPNNCGGTGRVCASGLVCSNGACASPSANPTATAQPTNQPTATPNPTKTPSPTKTPVPTTRTYIPPSDQGIPQTGTGLPAIIGAGIGIMLLVSAFVLAL